MSQTGIEEIFASTLAQVEAGRSPEDALAEHPFVADEIRPLIEITRRAGQLPVRPMNSAAKASLVAGLDSRLSKWVINPPGAGAGAADSGSQPPVGPLAGPRTYRRSRRRPLAAFAWWPQVAQGMAAAALLVLVTAGLLWSASGLIEPSTGVTPSPALSSPVRTEDNTAPSPTNTPAGTTAATIASVRADAITTPAFTTAPAAATTEDDDTGRAEDAMTSLAVQTTVQTTLQTATAFSTPEPRSTAGSETKQGQSQSGRITTAGANRTTEVRPATTRAPSTTSAATMAATTGTARATAAATTVVRVTTAPATTTRVATAVATTPVRTTAPSTTVDAPSRTVAPGTTSSNSGPSTPQPGTTSNSGPGGGGTSGSSTTAPSTTAPSTTARNTTSAPTTSGNSGSSTKTPTPATTGNSGSGSSNSGSSTKTPAPTTPK